MIVEAAIRCERWASVFKCIQRATGADGKSPASANFKHILRIWVHCGRDRLKQGAVALISWLPDPNPSRPSLFMPSLLDQYLPLAVFMAVAAAISGALLLAPFLAAFKAPDPEKLSAYECGFNAFDDARMQFDVRFYLVSLLFIIFDLEVAFLFPWAAAFREAGPFGFWSMMIFLSVLTIGFVYEWRKGALEWD
jgi:NADH-quinone oxidoreductase subunit A